MLTWRQKQAYGHRFRMYRLTEVEDSDGATQPAVYAMIYDQRACMFQITPYRMQPSQIGQQMDRIALAENQLECEASLDLRDADIIVDQTPIGKAGQGANRGSVYTATGDAERHPTTGIREPNYLILRLMPNDGKNLPAEITAA